MERPEYDNSWYNRTVGSHFATVRFTTIHFYDTCRVGPSTPDLWCVAVATQASFLYLWRFWLFSGVRVFLLFLFWCGSFKLIVIFPSMTSIKKTEKKKKSKHLTLDSFSMCSEPRPGPFQQNIKLFDWYFFNYLCNFLYTQIIKLKLYVIM